MKLSRLPTLLLLCAGLVPGCLSVNESPNDSANTDDVVASAAHEIINEANPEVAAGRYHTCAVWSGEVWCWGLNNYGQLGNGSFVSVPWPMRVGNISDAVAVNAGWYHSCAIRAGGSAMCWGRNDFGQLGDGTTTNRSRPVNVANMSDATSISSGAHHTCASRGDGVAACWGRNQYGQLGTTTTTNATRPAAVGQYITFWGYRLFIPEVNIAEVEAGAMSTCARLTTGSVRCWGYNRYGQLGDGTTQNKSRAVAVASLSTATDLTVGSYHACAVTGSGEAHCWGRNNRGQLGDATRTNRARPVRMKRTIRSGTQVPAHRIVSAGDQHTCSIGNDDSLWCVGLNSYGQLFRDKSLGDSLTLRRSSIRSQQVSAGGFHTCALTTNDELRCVGRNSRGQLGGFDVCPAAAVSISKFEASPGSRMLTKGPGQNDSEAEATVHYVTGTSVDVELSMPNCTQLSEVHMGQQALGSSPDPDGGSRYYEVLRTATELDGSKKVSVRVHFTNHGTGVTHPLRFVGRNERGTLAEADTVVVGALDVQKRQSDPNNPAPGATIFMSKNEIRNEVVSGIYAKYGDNNYYKREDANGDPQWPHVYDFDYDGFAFGMSNAGISFSAKTKVNLGKYLDVCNPTATVWGTFRVYVDSQDNVKTEWLPQSGRDGAQIRIDWPLGCSALMVVSNPLVATFGWLITGKLEDRIEKKVANLSQFCPNGTCDMINNVESTSDGITITLNDVLDIVTIRVPYNSTSIRDPDGFTDPMSTGIAVPSRSVPLLLPTGSAKACTIGAWPCDTRLVSGAGLFNLNGDDQPVPPPEAGCTTTTTPCPYYEGRSKAWRALRGLRRDMARLPMPAHNPGSMLARVYEQIDGQLVDSGVMSAGARVCKAIDDSSSREIARRRRIVFGRNDFRPSTGGFAGEYGTGFAVMQIGFHTNGAGRRLPACDQ